MRLVGFLIVTLFALQSAKGRGVSLSGGYEDDITFVINNVEQKATESLETAKFILSNRLSANYSVQVIAQRDEILSKGQRTIQNIGNWINEHNTTGALVGNVQECIVFLLEETTSETYRYLSQIESLCWTKDSWNADIEVVVTKLSDLLEEAKNLYMNYMLETVKCAHETDSEQCKINVEIKIRDDAARILESRTTLLEQSYQVNQEYQGSVMECQRLMYEKIDLIEINVMKGLRDCAGIGQPKLVEDVN